ncbi:FAD-dependent monooxygenase [Nonomuraea sp. NPDC005650]|uniref:FAD-dependent monooxygenase n=1 Tax=Nonomuraea sp. NPDC005650 TaxID=3157045 RepID=UPI0033AF154A
MIDGPVIVGAGPVGLATALLARARGLPAHVLERLPAAAPKPGSRATFLHRQTIQTLATACPVLADQLVREGLVWPGRGTYWAGRRVHHRCYEPVRPRLAPFISLPQPRTEELLHEAGVRAGVTFSWGAQADEVVLQDTSVLIRAVDGREWRSAFVVAADGAGSVMRRRLGIPMNGDTAGAPFVVVDIAEDPARPLPAERVFHYRHPLAGGRNVLFIPFAGGHRVDLQCRGRDDPARLAAEPRAWLRSLLPPGHACEVTWSSHYLFRQAVAETFTLGRVLLAGEAAHLYAPFGARGLNSGIADAAAAVDAIAEAGTDPGARHRVLAEYDQVRRAAAERNRAAAGKALAHLTAAGPHRQAAQRAAALAARVLPRAGTWLDSKPYGPRDAGIPGSLY